VQVLEHAVVDCEQRCKQLLADSLAAAAAEREARASLAGAREAQAAAERGLQQQTQRLLAAERMRLADLKVCLWVGGMRQAGVQCARLRANLTVHRLLFSAHKTRARTHTHTHTHTRAHARNACGHRSSRAWSVG
jgi:hypothetical protein